MLHARIRALAFRAVLGTVVASTAVAGLPMPAQAEAPIAPFDDHAGGDVGAATTSADPEPDPETSTCDGVPTHEIGAVQGSGDATPIAGRQVTVRGVVVGDVPGLSGFYLQDPDGDGDTATSDGVFVFSSVPVDLGNTVAVTGTSDEFGGQTQLTAREDVDVCDEGSVADLPTATPLDLPADHAARERLEGMLVSPVDGLTVSEVCDLTSFGELTLSEGGLLVQPTELALAGYARGAGRRCGQHRAPDRAGRRTERARHNWHASPPVARDAGPRR
jgi:predicted extracellular nuclease